MSQRMDSADGGEYDVRGMPDEGPDAQKRVIGATIRDVLVLNLYVVNGKEVGDPKYEFKLDWLGRLATMVKETILVFFFFFGGGGFGGGSFRWGKLYFGWGGVEFFPEL